MKKLLLLSALVLWGGSVLHAKPNVLVFLTDDQGWGDLSMNGNSNFWKRRILIPLPGTELPLIVSS